MRVAHVFAVMVLQCWVLFSAVADSSVQPESSSHRRTAIEKCDPRLWEKYDFVEARISRTIDGDTVHIEFRGKTYSVRMLLIDTPETNFQGKSQGEWGERASARLAELLPPKTRVQVTFDGDRCDKYGRVLGHIWIRKKQNINFQMLDEALAVNYCIYPNLAYCKDAEKVTRENIRTKRGMYSDPSLELPYNWRRRVSNRPHEKYVGNILNYKVYKPGPNGLRRVPVGARVFFMNRSDIQPPYYLAE